MSQCSCGQAVWIRKTGECQRCYHQRYARTHTRYVPKPIVYTAPMPPTTLTSYLGAHQRVWRWRGKASDYTCTCGNHATEWSYRGDSPHEQTGPRRRRGRNTTTIVHTTWSPNVLDYDPLCADCHRLRDRKYPA